MNWSDKIIVFVVEQEYSIFPMSLQEIIDFSKVYYTHICEQTIIAKKQCKETITYYCWPRYHDAKVDVAVFKVWFNQMSPGIVVSKQNLYKIVYGTYWFIFVGMAHTFYVSIGTFYKNLKRDHFLEAHEEYGERYSSEIEYFYGPEEDWDGKSQYLAESVRVISPNGDGVYKEQFYTLEEGDDLPLDEINAEFMDEAYNPSVGDDLMFDREDEPEFFSKCYAEDNPDDYNHSRLDAIGAENLDFFIETMKVIVKEEQRQKALAEEKEKEKLKQNFKIIEKDLIKITAEVLAVHKQKEKELKEKELKEKELKEKGLKEKIVENKGKNATKI